MKKRKILVIDDEPAFTNLVRLNLERTGWYEVREQNHAHGAIAAARDFLPDLILLDVVMPDQDGGTIASQISANPELRQIPIVLVTAVISAKEAGADGFKSGGFLFLSKPISARRLIRCIETILATRSIAGA